MFLHEFQVETKIPWLRLIIPYLMECDLGHLSDVVLSLVTLQDLDLDGVGEACRLECKLCIRSTAQM